MKVERARVDDDGNYIEAVLVEDTDENGDPVVFPPNLVPPNTAGGIWLPKWNFNLLRWEEGDPDRALRENKSNKIFQYESECNALIEKGFEHNGDFFRFLKDPDQDNFTQQLVVLMASIVMGTPLDDKPIEWMTENNGAKLFNKDEFFAVCQAGMVHKRSLLSAKWQLINYINNDVHDLETLNSLGDFETAKNIVL